MIEKMTFSEFVKKYSLRMIEVTFCVAVLSAIVIETARMWLDRIYNRGANHVETSIYNLS